MSSSLSPEVLSRHIPQSSAGQVLSGLWIGNLMSVSHLDDIISTTPRSGSNTSSVSDEKKKDVVITVISVLSNPNLIRLATDLIEKQRNKKDIKDCNRTIDIKHVVIQLKDTVDSDLSSILPSHVLPGYSFIYCPQF
mgnify:CR=1 FL=1